MGLRNKIIRSHIYNYIKKLFIYFIAIVIFFVMMILIMMTK